MSCSKLAGLKLSKWSGHLWGIRKANPSAGGRFYCDGCRLCCDLNRAKCTRLLLFAHCSQETGHRAVLEMLAAEPLLDLGLRLGEGTGAVLALGLVRAAVEFYNHMASFADAGVTV